MVLSLTVTRRTDQYLAELAVGGDRRLLETFHETLGDGAADEILGQIRPQFTATAEQFTFRPPQPMPLTRGSASAALGHCLLP
jgi:hypothetical protein